MAFLFVRGTPFPYPNKDSGLQTIATLVTSGRNESGVFIGRKIGRDQSKVELQWSSMAAATWAQLLQIFDEHFVNPVTYYDMSKGTMITRNMYVSDRTAKPQKIDPNTGAWIIAKDCVLSLVDTGA